jgi:hypothetical protein
MIFSKQIKNSVSASIRFSRPNKNRDRCIKKVLLDYSPTSKKEDNLAGSQITAQRAVCMASTSDF